MAKTKTTGKVVIDQKVVANTVKAYKTEIKTRRTDLDRQYRALDKEGDSIYKLEAELSDLEQILRLSGAFAKVAK